MTGAEDYLKEIIRLQLKKPKNWNWELSTSKSSPHIALPTIQLYNTKGQLLVETNDNGTTNRQSWHNSQYREKSKDRESTRSGRNPAYLQRCRSDNLEKRMAQYRSSVVSAAQPILKIEATEIRKQPKAIQRCRSDTLGVPFFQDNSLNRITDSVRSYRSRSRDPQFDRLREKNSPEEKDKSSCGSSDFAKSNKGKLGRFGQFVEGIKNDKRESKNTDGIYHLQKSRSDVLGIKVKSKPQHTLSDKHPIRPYHKRADSDDLLQKTRQKYNIKESLKRAENDGYKNFIYSDENLKRNYRERSEERRKENESKNEKKKRFAGYLASAETVMCNNKPTNFEVNNVAKPKRYRLRQSRAGILVISDESFSSSHRRRCHGEFGDCRQDINDIIIHGDLPIFKERPMSFRCTPQRSRSEKDNIDVSRTSHDASSNNNSQSRHFRQSSDPAGVKTAKFPSNRYRTPQHTNDVCNNVERTDSTREAFYAKRTPRNENYLFQSKSDIFPFQKLFSQKLTNSYDIYDKKLSLDSDDNSSYIVQEPLTTTGSESGKNECESALITERCVRKQHTKLRTRHSDGAYSWRTCEDKPKGTTPITLYGNQNTRIVLNQSANMPVANWINQVNPNGTRYKEDDPAYSMFQDCAKTKGTIGTRCSSVVWIKSNKMQLVNITIENYASNTADGQAVALRTDSKEVQLESVMLLGHQDTFYVGSGTVFVNNSYLEGDIDYVFGQGTAVFNNCTFKTLSNRRNDAVIFAPKTDSSNSYGFLVINSFITADNAFQNRTQVRLGRPWDPKVYVPDQSPNGQILIRNSRIDAIVNVTGPWGQGIGSKRVFSGNIDEDRDLNDNKFNRFWEYQNYGNGS